MRAATSCVADYGVTGSHLTAELEAIRREVAGTARPDPGAGNVLADSGRNGEYSAG